MAKSETVHLAIDHPLDHPRLDEHTQTALDAIRSPFLHILSDGSYGTPNKAQVDVIAYLGYLGIGMVQLERASHEGQGWIARTLLDLDMVNDDAVDEEATAARMHYPLGMIALDEWVTVTVPVYAQVVEQAALDGIHILASSDVSTPEIQALLHPIREQTDEEVLAQARANHPEMPDNVIVKRVALPGGFNATVVADPSFAQSIDQINEVLAAPEDEFAIPGPREEARDFILSKTEAIHTMAHLGRVVLPILHEYFTEGYYGGRPLDQPTPESADVDMEITPITGAVDLCPNTEKGREFITKRVIASRRLGAPMGAPVWVGDNDDDPAHLHAVCSLLVLPMLISDADTAGVVIYSPGITRLPGGFHGAPEDH